MIRFTTKALVIAALALITFVATAPTASADGGTLDVNGSDFALSNFSVHGDFVGANLQNAGDGFVLLLESLGGDVNSFTIASDGTIYKFAGLKFWGVDFWTGDFDYKFKKKESTSTPTAPEPGTIFLIGGGLLALALFSSRKALRA
jgi:PEP-CTERM motif